jgi:hypothetical protein
MAELNSIHSLDGCTSAPIPDRAEIGDRTIVGIAAMIYGLAAGVMIVLNREDGGSPD